MFRTRRSLLMRRPLELLTFSECDNDAMKVLDLALNALIPVLILVHLVVSPYTKVEESFSLQATHDVLTYGIPTSDVSARLRSTYDHFEFPGAVPRTFVGAVVLAGISQPVLSIVGAQHGQLVVRAMLGLFNAFALLRFASGVDRAFGKAAGRWYRLLQASQFQVIYYASRTLPNMFAFGLSTLALREILPMPLTPLFRGDTVTRRHRMAIYLLVLSGVIFRSEMAILLSTQLLYLILLPASNLQIILPACIRSVIVALAISIPIDSYFWQTPIWPELAGFIFNAIRGNSSAWGTSPIHAYFTSFLPKLLLNPLIPTLLLPLSLYLPATRRVAAGLILPSLAFITIYSLQPHKEARFIIYAVPPFTAAAALSASYIFTRRAKTLAYALLSTAIVLSISASFAASFLFLALSSLNYPGGEALWQLHQLAVRNPRTPSAISVHMDVLSCMTGVSRFQQNFPTPPLAAYFASAAADDRTVAAGRPSQVHWRYSKEENGTALLTPEFWAQFDYVLTETPETVIGKWDVVHTVFGFAGIEVLRPGARPAPDRGMAEEVAEEIGIADRKTYARKLGRYEEVRELVRKRFTRGWWVGPRMEAKVRILKRIQ